MNTRLTLVLIIVVGLVTACGEDEEEPVPAVERCQLEGFSAFTEGSVSDGDQSASLNVETMQGTPGRVSPQEIRIQLGHALAPGADGEDDEPLPLLLRLVDPDSPQDFARYIDEQTLDEPLILDVFDATGIGAGSEDLTSLDDFDCTIEDGTICMQVGFDAAGDGILFDNDEHVYNAASGTVTIDGFESGSNRGFSAYWDIELGRNIVRHDDSSSGSLQGCIRPHYEPRTDYWILE